MKKKLLHNLGLKITSLLLAFLLWLVIVQMGDPQDTDYFNVSVHLINTELLDREDKVYEVLDDTDAVRVTVRAPKSVLKDLREADIVAEADVSLLTEINTVPISFSIPNLGKNDSAAISITGNHNVVRLNVEDRDSKYVSLIGDTTGEVAEGYIVAGISTDQNRIEVSGPESAVAQVKYAGVVMDVSGATSNLSANMEILLWDAEGNQLDQKNIVKNVNYVRTSVEVLATKQVPIQIEYSGVPAEGYMATGETASDPDSVLIAGTTAELANVSRIVVPGEKINISGESGDVVETVNLKEYLPSNVQFADSEFNGRITATVYILPVEERTLDIPAENLRIVNLPEGFEAQWQEDVESYALRLRGLEAVLDTLRPSEIQGTVDIAAWMKARNMTTLRAGTYSVPVTFDLAEGTIAQNEITVQLSINRVNE